MSQESARRWLATSWKVCATLSCIAAANALVVAFLGGYRVVARGASLDMRSLDTALAAALAASCAGWLFAAALRGARATLSTLGAASALALSAGLALMLTAQRSGVASVAALASAAFLVAWAAYGRRPHGRVAAAWVYIALAVAVATGMPGSPGGVEVAATAAAAAAGGSATAGAAPARQVIPGDRPFLMARNGFGVEFSREQLASDCRNAAAVSAGGFFSLRVPPAGGQELRFAAAAKGSVSGLTAKVTLVSLARVQTVVWQKHANELSQTSWLNVSIPLPEDFRGEAVFEVNGDGRGKALFGAPRIMTPDPSRPNIILVVADALRPDRLGIYGSDLGLSPGIDALAGRATVFERCQSQAPWTIPAMGSLLTSLHPTVHGMVSYKTALSASLDTLAEALSRSGYSTACVQTNPNLTPDRGVAQGFDEYLLGPHHTTRRDVYPYWRADQVCRQAMSAIKRHAGEPFFLYLHFMDTHSPYMPPKAFDRYGDDSEGRYNGSVAYFSDRFARFMDTLDREGLLEDTLVVLTSDHGEQFLEHGATEHGNCLHAEELMVPLAAWLPGASEGARAPALVRSIDIAPTLAEMARAPALEAAAGSSFASSLRDPSSIHDRPAYAELESLKAPGQTQASHFDGRFRIIVTDPESEWKRRVQLYDVREDPREYINLAADKCDILDPLLANVTEFVADRREIHKRLVPSETTVKLSRDRIEQLKALGYINPNSP